MALQQKEITDTDAAARGLPTKPNYADCILQPVSD